MGERPLTADTDPQVSRQPRPPPAAVNPAPRRSRTGCNRLCTFRAMCTAVHATSRQLRHRDVTARHAGGLGVEDQGPHT